MAVVAKSKLWGALGMWCWWSKVVDWEEDYELADKGLR